jgi:antitoxin ParD1/3/4
VIAFCRNSSFRLKTTKTEISSQGDKGKTAIAKIKTIIKKSQTLTTMKLTLKPEHQKLIEAQLDTGRYANPDEIIAEALQLLDKRDQYQQWVEEVGQKIDIAAEQLDRGEGIDGETAIAQLKARLHENCEA